MAGNTQSSNIKVYQKKKHLNIGIIIFGVIFIYLVVTVLMYLTEKHISVYEVREGSILKDNSYTGLATVSYTHLKGIMIANFGGETTELSVLAGGGMVLNRLVKVGGHTFDQGIINLVKHSHDCLLYTSKLRLSLFRPGFHCS